VWLKLSDKTSETSMVIYSMHVTCKAYLCYLCDVIENQDMKPFRIQINHASSNFIKFIVLMLDQ